jgi:hypothetical protein
VPGIELEGVRELLHNVVHTLQELGAVCVCCVRVRVLCACVRALRCATAQQHSSSTAAQQHNSSTTAAQQHRRSTAAAQQQQLTTAAAAAQQQQQQQQQQGLHTCRNMGDSSCVLLPPDPVRSLNLWPKSHH